MVRRFISIQAIMCPGDPHPWVRRSIAGALRSYGSVWCKVLVGSISAAPGLRSFVKGTQKKMHGPETHWSKMPIRVLPYGAVSGN